MNIKRRVYEILEVARPGDTASQVFDIFLVAIIVVNVVAVVVGTIPELSSDVHRWLSTIESVSIVIFTVEYLLRIWSCTAGDTSRSSLGGRLRFVSSPMMIIDLLAILPAYIPMVLPIDLRILRMFRLFRIFRVLKLGRYSSALQLFGRVLRAKRAELAIVMFVLVVLLVVSSSIMYYIENPHQRESFSSIPAAMWWGIVTLSTLGYGDMYPVTVWGKIVGMMVAMLGIGLFALPAGILGSAFVEELQRRRWEISKCPHCGREIE